MTNLKRAGPPRAGPSEPLTTKAPAATGALWSSDNLSSCGKHTPRSDGTGPVAMICAFSTGWEEVIDRG